MKLSKSLLSLVTLGVPFSHAQHLRADERSAIAINPMTLQEQELIIESEDCAEFRLKIAEQIQEQLDASTPESWIETHCSLVGRELMNIAIQHMEADVANAAFAADHPCLVAAESILLEQSPRLHQFVLSHDDCQNEIFQELKLAGSIEEDDGRSLSVAGHPCRSVCIEATIVANPMTISLVLAGIASFWW